MKLISLEAAIAMGGCSKRTWWRRISENPSIKKGADARGRALLSLDAVHSFMSLPEDPDLIDLIMSADKGNAEAQNECALIFSENNRHDTAVYWWKLSVEQGHRDAMHHLGRCYIEGVGVSQDEHLGIMWLAKSASCGHAIASAQIVSLRPF